LDEPSRWREDEWFRQNERKLLEEAHRAREKREAERKASETAAHREKLKQQHWMKCPKCGHDLATQKLDQIEIDRCTFCEGFFVDAGELEQLFLKRSQSERRGVWKRLLGL
jgi:uncharacterized protein